MANTYNIYCDESCHLEHDNKPIMAIAAVWCPLEKTRQISEEIREIKEKYKLKKHLEIKWTKVSPGKIDFYKQLVTYFFNEKDLHFRIILIPKDKLDHKAFSQTHDDLYYKICFLLLEQIIEPDSHYRIYLDIKDTRSETKRCKLEQYLRNKKYDRTREIITWIQQIHSHESEIMQMADFLMGAVRYSNEPCINGQQKSKAKIDIIEQIKTLSGKTLFESTWPKEAKFNIFHWKGSWER